MNYKPILLLIGCCIYPALGHAQDSLKTTISYDITSEAAVGTGDFTAYQLATNRHHVLGTRSNTAYIRGAVQISHDLSRDWKLSGGIDAIGSAHADHQAYMQQCYANLSYQKFFLEVGEREQHQVLRDEDLSIGSFIKGTNAKPMVQVHIGTDGFWSVPFTKGILELNFDGGYGTYLDGNYRERKFNEAPIVNGQNINRCYATDILYHQKHFYFRLNFNEHLFFIGGMEHIVQFGGTTHAYNRNGEFVTKKSSTKLKSLLEVVLPFGDSNYAEHDAMEDWIFGNHLGEMTVQLGWNINKNHTVQAYLDDIFEDGSGMRKSNGADGTWGLQYNNKTTGIQYIRGAVLEYFQSTNQSGPLHWDPNDYAEPIRSQITDYVVGSDNYYNHFTYNSYSVYGMTPGIALITSPIYNKDGYTAFKDNRVKAWHVGVNGEISNHLSYLVKGSYREGWGTYSRPLANKHHSFDAMIQGKYHKGPWQFSASYAFDKGNIYGDNSTFDIKIGYHGKIL